MILILERKFARIILQQKVGVLISDWLPAVINKSTEARIEADVSVTQQKHLL